jgi:hypothetical protein
MSNLHTLTLYFDLVLDFGVVCQVLAQIEAPRLDTLIICLSQSAVHAGRRHRDRWHLLAQELASQRWAQMRSITFTMPPTDEDGYESSSMTILESCVLSNIGRSMERGTTVQCVPNDVWERSGDTWDRYCY